MRNSDLHLEGETVYVGNTQREKSKYHFILSQLQSYQDQESNVEHSFSIFKWSGCGYTDGTALHQYSRPSEKGNFLTSAQHHLCCQHNALMYQYLDLLHCQKLDTSFSTMAVPKAMASRIQISQLHKNAGVPMSQTKPRINLYSPFGGFVLANSASVS